MKSRDVLGHKKILASFLIVLALFLLTVNFAEGVQNAKKTNAIKKSGSTGQLKPASAAPSPQSDQGSQSSNSGSSGRSRATISATFTITPFAAMNGICANIYGSATDTAGNQLTYKLYDDDTNNTLLASGNIGGTEQLLKGAHCFGAAAPSGSITYNPHLNVADGKGTWVDYLRQVELVSRSTSVANSDSLTVNFGSEYSNVNDILISGIANGNNCAGSIKGIAYDDAGNKVAEFIDTRTPAGMSTEKSFLVDKIKVRKIVGTVIADSDDSTADCTKIGQFDATIARIS